MTATALPATRARRLGLWSTTIGKKLLVAITGLGWIGFVFAHMVGNLKYFLGGKHYDEYGEFLRRMGEPVFPRTVLLWLLRTGLIVAFFAHVGIVYVLAKRNRESRPGRYAKTAHIQANPASLMMKWGGITILLFLLFHLAQFTWGNSHTIAYTRGDPYGNMGRAFYHRYWMGLIYLAAMVALAGHIYHGFWSTMQTLGFNRRRWDGLFRRTATALAAVIVGGNVLIILGATFIAHPNL
jgi:succinate dehydrogenase / fumarate reductase cytochrome b subunit